ncbi:universal stress protein [Haloechinothrix sp. LS1_15]|uniref:universal stress protein n=1 Tax=Haloechinothrix sp. LS1_15 TaxID=2652248 RepID=UPI0029453E2B|nr:universal stress protein [Haloechinothrix sp. LS1_15]MDV6014443.1 universal stress protein [Haloechinothrix sp. LS1_15]
MGHSDTSAHHAEHGRSGPVVVGVDGSEAALRAVTWAAHEARLRHAALRIVHAIGIPDFFPGGAISPSTELFHLLERDADAALADARELAERVGGGIVVGTETLTDSPVVSLIDESARARCVVLGESGRGAFAGALLGSTTITLAAHARCPVVAVRGPGERVQANTVVVGVDGSELSDDALGCAFEQAAFRGARLVAVRATGDGDTGEPGARSPVPSGGEPPDGTEHRVLAECLAGWAERYPDVEVQRDVARAKPRQRLLDWSDSADLVVVGCRGRGGFRGMLLGSTSQALLHHATCPVMVVRRHCATVPQGV